MSVEKSQALLKRSEAVIPLGAQTFSKSKLAYPEGCPLFVTHGKGGHVWDVDGNEYIDMVSGLLPNVLGYCDPDVDAAIRNQLCLGISFSLSTELEVELAERLKKHIPCAEMSRFGKSGTDVTSAAVRLARAYTGRQEIVALGYHGWHDWSICRTSRNLGVPAEMAFLCSPHLDDLGTRTAALVVEASASKEQLERYRWLADSVGALLIFDEVITGFRWHIGGAQAYYGVTPDLACFGKAMGNGMPISALCGSAKIMQLMEKVCFSGTFFGETLSLAAAIATIDKIERENVCDRLWELARKLGMNAPWQPLKFRDDGAKGEFIKSMCADGVLTGGSYNVCWAHTNADIEKVLWAEKRALAAIDNEDRTQPIRPLFNTRAA